MGCCGQRRSLPPAPQHPSWPAATEYSRGWPPVRSGAGMRGARSDARGVMLRHRERTRLLVRGPVSGRNYEFAPQQATQVGARDAEILLRTGRFIRA